MKNYVLLVYLLVIIVSFPISLLAQNQLYAPDTVIRYALIGKDTVNKQPLSKEIYLFDYKFRLKEKSLFTWNVSEKQWQKSKKFELSYYPTEILVNCYDIEGKNQQIQSQRILIQLDKQANIIEVSLQRKDRYTEKFSLVEKKNYKYQQDTLKQSLYYRMINQLTLEKEVNYLYTKNLVVEKEVVYNQSGQELSKNQRKIELKGRDVIRVQTMESSFPKDTIIEKFEYSDRLLSKKLTSLVCSSKVKSNHQHKIVYPFQVQFFYDKEGNLLSELYRKLDKENLVRADRENRLVEWVYSTKTPYSTDKLKLNPKVNDFLN
ncbi:MAG: hypothetical protein KA198_05220 [Chitinophagaceae bacterium]|nr:hypothetical protein [Chitinophagaceae bacterium]